MALSLDKRPTPPPAGVFVPAVTFFNHEDDTLDLDSQEKYFKYQANSGITGLVILGTNAETFLLTTEERADIITLARKAVGPDFPIIAGCGGHSTKQVLQHLNIAAQSGADYALVLPPGYFAKATTPEVISDFFDIIATKSPLPVLIYNFPGIVNGIDLDTDTIIALAKKHPNIVGVKLSCGKVGKATRLAATLVPEEFSTYAGQSDFLIPGLSVGSAGCITSFGNAFPKTIAKIYSLYKEGKHEEALALQRRAALAEAPTKWGIPSVKYATAIYSAKAAGIKDAETKLRPRSPYRELSDAQKATIRAAMDGLTETEDGL